WSSALHPYHRQKPPWKPARSPHSTVSDATIKIGINQPFVKIGYRLQCPNRRKSGDIMRPGCRGVLRHSDQFASPDRCRVPVPPEFLEFALDANVTCG